MTRRRWIEEVRSDPEATIWERRLAQTLKNWLDVAQAMITAVPPALVIQAVVASGTTIAGVPVRFDTVWLLATIVFFRRGPTFLNDSLPPS